MLKSPSSYLDKGGSSCQSEGANPQKDRTKIEVLRDLMMISLRLGIYDNGANICDIKCNDGDNVDDGGWLS